ncbi:MAG: 50S ribosomal protein L27 [Candidatus Shapirobacteria bacterium]
MAKSKAAGKTTQKTTRAGKRLGVKVFGGQKIRAGQIIIRQRGTKYFAGPGVKTASDYTLFATKNGLVKFKKNQGKQIVSVL